jgi:NADH:ubiquinone oxidoreductase subunit E
LGFREETRLQPLIHSLIFLSSFFAKYSKLANFFFSSIENYLHLSYAEDSVGAMPGCRWGNHRGMNFTGYGAIVVILAGYRGLFLCVFLSFTTIKKMSMSHKFVSQFSLEGDILELQVKDGDKLKSLKMAIGSNEEIWIKVSPKLRGYLGKVLKPGFRVRVMGVKKINWTKGKIKWKADRLIEVVNFSYINQNDILSDSTLINVESKLGFPEEKGDGFSTVSSVSQVPVSGSQGKAKILVCQKSDCQKRGGKAVCQALQAMIESRGLENQVKIQETGCLKLCKAAPNLIIMPDKVRYSRVDVREVSDLLDRHFVSENEGVMVGVD